MRQKNNETAAVPRVVGIVDSQAAVRIARLLKPQKVDLLEWRADCLPGLEMPVVGLPWILTVRDPAEGGKGEFRAEARRDVLLRLLPGSDLVDIECANLRAFSDVVDRAHAAQKQVIASFHDFEKTPPAPTLSRIIRQAADHGADIVKIAVGTHTPADVAVLLGLFDRVESPLALMGMGPLGMASRLVLAAAGSRLNYGWLHRPNVSGQWSATELRRLVGRVTP